MLGLQENALVSAADIDDIGKTPTCRRLKIGANELEGDVKQDWRVIHDQSLLFALYLHALSTAPFAEAVYCI